MQPEEQNPVWTYLIENDFVLYVGRAFPAAADEYYGGQFETALAAHDAGLAVLRKMRNDIVRRIKVEKANNRYLRQHGTLPTDARIEAAGGLSLPTDGA